MYLSISFWVKLKGYEPCLGIFGFWFSFNSLPLKSAEWVDFSSSSDLFLGKPIIISLLFILLYCFVLFFDLLGFSSTNGIALCPDLFFICDYLNKLLFVIL